MRKKLLAGIVAALVGVSASVHATQITGAIGFLGNYTTDNTDLTQATSIIIGNAIVGDSSGALSFPFGTPVVMATSLQVNPPTFPIAALWQVGGFTFDLTFQSQTPAATQTSLVLEGHGTISGNGYDPTPGTWTATFNSQGTGSLTWSSSSSAPDGGLTLMLLGSAFSGLAFIRRRIKS